MSLEEVLREITDVKGRILRAIPGSIAHSDLIVALVVLQDLAIQLALGLRQAA